MPNRVRNRAGERVGHLTALEPTDKRSNIGKVIWKLKCDCGNIIYRAFSPNMRKSCGCDLHGKSKSRIYKIWCSMKARCENPNDKAYKNYGGRGIKVCPQWSGKNGFINFYNDMGDKPPRLSIDRIDNNGNYSPENCRWATKKEQQNNTRTNRMITINGVTKTIHQWCEERGMKYETVRRRIDTYHWPIQDAIFTPKHGEYHKGLSHA